MSKDTDIKALQYAKKWLNQSTSRKMLTANLNFLLDYYLVHPSKELPGHLQDGKP